MASVAYFYNQHYLGLNALSAALFLVFCFGLLGHVLPARLWKTCIWPTLLAIFVLPFEGYLDIFLGFPLRLISAEVVSDLLTRLGIPSASTDSVLFIENRAAIVDLDCSGIRGFWIGCIFFCAITWIENYRLDIRWLAIALFTFFLIFAANILRIAVLVVLDLSLNRADLAQVFHESLGLVGFTFSMAIGWQLLRLYGRHSHIKPSPNSEKPKQPQRYMTSSASTIIGLLVVLNLIWADQSNDKAIGLSSIDLSDSTYLKFTSQALSDSEKAFFQANSSSVRKYLTTIESNSGLYTASVLIVLSRDWKSHHVPANCYAAQGYEIRSSVVQSVNWLPAPKAFFPVRHLELTKPSPIGAVNSRYFADYWFQSAKQITPNFSKRVIAQITHPGRPWTMVSVLWEEDVPLDVRHQALTNIRKLVAKQMEAL